MSEQSNQNELLALTTQIVAAHVANNTVAVTDLPQLIHEVFRTLSSVGTVPVALERPQPAVPVKKSVTPDYIICLEDGKKLKMLKRHLKTAYNMSPEEYRDRWDCRPTIRWLPRIMPSIAVRWPRRLVWAPSRASVVAPLFDALSKPALPWANVQGSAGLSLQSL